MAAEKEDDMLTIMEELITRYPQLGVCRGEVEEACRALLELTAQTGGIDLVEQGYTYSQKMGLTEISQIFERLLALHRLLEAEGMSQELVYDLGMTADLHYYTGIVFQGYTDGTGDYVLDGGRYDDLLRQFSKNWPSVGLGIYMNSLSGDCARGTGADLSFRDGREDGTAGRQNPAGWGARRSAPFWKGSGKL